MPSPTQKEEDRFEKIVARLDDLTFDGEGNAQGSGHAAYVKVTQALHAAGQKWQVVFQKAAQSATAAPAGTGLQAQLDAFISANAEMARANEELRRENEFLRKKYSFRIKLARIGGACVRPFRNTFRAVRPANTTSGGLYGWSRRERAPSMLGSVACGIGRLAGETALVLTFPVSYAIAPLRRWSNLDFMRGEWNYEFSGHFIGTFVYGMGGIATLAAVCVANGAVVDSRLQEKADKIFPVAIQENIPQKLYPLNVKDMLGAPLQEDLQYLGSGISSGTDASGNSASRFCYSAQIIMMMQDSTGLYKPTLDTDFRPLQKCGPMIPLKNSSLGAAPKP